MEIAKCTQAQVAEAGAFYDRCVLHLEKHTNYPKWTYKDYPSEKTVRNAVESGTQFLCVEGGAIVAAFILDDVPHGAYEKGAWSRELSKGEYALIHALCVGTEFSGRGIGRNIVSFCIDEARRQGFKAIRLDVVPENEPAKRLYESAGFVRVGDYDLELGVPELVPLSLYELNV